MLSTVIRDADATRQRLLEAARAEFAAYGIAGARVDRIAASARSNKAQIYHYFGSKDELFDAVFATVVEQVVTEIPLDVSDLPGYAARLAQGYDEHPDVMRLATWQRLERGTDAPVRLAVDSTREKVDAIARAQAEGLLPGDFPAGVLLTLVLHLAAVWSAVNPEQAAAAGVPDTSQQHEFVADAVRRLLLTQHPAPNEVHEPKAWTDDG
jgi:AcrR family transcriptional regulator